MNTRRFVTSAILGSFLSFAPAIVAAQSPFGASGARGGRVLDTALPNEAVDPFSGSLSIVATDLVLPGNAGLDVKVQRVYDSTIYPDYKDDDLTIEEDSWAGIGWKLHFGRVLDPDATVGGATQIEMGDGARQILYTTTAFPEGWITKSFWRYDKSTHTLKLPNGAVYVFGHSVYLNATLGTVRYVTEVRDPFNNRLEFSYFGAPGPVDGVSQIRQFLGGGQTREINFTYDATLKGLATMTYNGRTWTYTQEPAGPSGFSVLRRVQPPAGVATEYEYSGSAPGHELTKLWTPGGGSLTYTYGDVFQISGSVTTKVRAVTTKVLGGYEVTPGTWTYAYATGGNHDTTRVTCPCGTTTYRFNGVGSSGPFAGWLAGTLAERTVEDQAVVIEREQMTWVASEGISTDPTVGPGGIWSDPGVFKALLQTRTLIRGAQSWTSTYEYHAGLGNFNDYGRAWKVYEDGELHRSITRTFQYGFTPYIVDRVAKEEHWSSPEGFERNWSYDLSTGFMTSQSMGPNVPNGMTSTFVPTSTGNVWKAFDPRGNQTTISYSWGRASLVQTPHVTTSYVINSDGTTQSESIGPLTTSYTYDNAFRLLAAHPPGGTQPITYEYDNVYSRFVIVRRLPSATDYRFDGLGRVIKVTNAVNLKTRVARDGCGRTTFESYPYTSGFGTRGVQTDYDALGRVTRVTDGDAVTQNVYTGIDVTITDPNNRVTIYDYSAFAGPESSQLKRVRDADTKFTDYTYDLFGNLVGVSGPAASPPASPARTWSYDGRSALLQDIQPEKGLSTYVHDQAGNLTQVTDATGTVVLTYDGNNRLTKRDAPGTGDDVELSYGTAGELLQMASPTLASPTTRTVYEYDTAGRVKKRTDLVNANSFSSQYAYTTNDTLQTVTYPSGRVVTYEPDAEGRTTVVKNNAANFATGFTYTDSGRLQSYVTGAVTHTVTYDTRDRVRQITVGPAGGLDLTYTYDAASQVKAIADPRPGMSQSFDYDLIGRLTGGDGPWGALRWAYDATGNRVTETRGLITSYHYDLPTRRLMSTSGAIAESFAYDGAGRLTSDSRGTYTYNARSLLVTATRPGLSAAYGYDPAGLRTTRSVNGDTTYTIRGAGGEVLSEYRAPCSTPVWGRDVVYAAGRLLGAVRANLIQPSVAVTADVATVAEGQTSVQVGVRLTTAGGATACPVTVAYETTPLNATVGGDYVATGGTVTFPANTLSGTVINITVPLLPDTVNEPLESFKLLLSSATGADIAIPARQTVTITDDDIAPAMAVEAPTAGATLRTPFTVSGWAIDESVPTGTGVDYISVHATPTGGSYIPLGGATYGQARPDIATLYNHSRFTNSGFTYTAHLPPGSYVVNVYAGNAATGWCCQVQAVPVTVAPANPQMALEAPATPGATLAQPFTMSGWAIDAGTSGGTGVASVQILAYPNPGSGTPPINLGNATYGISKPYVQQAYQAFGAGFTNSGFQKEVRGLAPGVYRLVAQALSTVTGTYNQLREITVTVAANPAMWVDTPGTNTSVNQTFMIAGWAVDAAAGSGTGVSTLHVWAYPNPGSGQSPIFLGVPAIGGARPDIAALYGSQFLNSGFGLSTTLSPGVYQIVVYAWSTVTSTFNQAQSVTVTVATSSPIMAIDAPAPSSTVSQPFAVTGWAIDLGSPSGPGIDAVHVHVISNGGAGTWTFIGAATYGGARPDVAAYYGHSKFTNSGYGITASGLAPGPYQVNVYEHSTVSGQWTVQTRFVTVQ